MRSLYEIQIESLLKPLLYTFVAMLLVAAAGCGNSDNSSLPSTSGPAQVTNQLLFVTNLNGPSITEYPNGTSGNVSPAASFVGANTTLASPTGIAINTTGTTLFVADFKNNSVVEFSPPTAAGNVAPVNTITGLSQPEGVAVDPSGNIYVANSASSTVNVYAPAATGNAT